MKRVCAWCNAFLGETDGDPDKVTHGICQPCYDREMALIEQERETRCHRCGKRLEVTETKTRTIVHPCPECMARAYAQGGMRP